MDDDEFDKIQKKVIDAMDEIADAFIDVDRRPSDTVVDALSEVFDCSSNQTRRMFANRAKARGSTFMQEHLRADD